MGQFVHNERYLRSDFRGGAVNDRHLAGQIQKGELADTKRGSGVGHTCMPNTKPDIELSCHESHDNYLSLLGYVQNTYRDGDYV